MLELFVNSKKELQVAESPLSKSSKILKISFGTTERFNIGTFKEYLSMIDFSELKEFKNFVL